MTDSSSDSSSLGWFLEALQPEIPQSLLSGSGLERVLTCASRLPLATAVFPFGLEIRQDEAEPAALGWLLGELERADSFLSRVVDFPMLEYDLINSAPNLPLDEPGLFLAAADDAGRMAFRNPGVMLAALASATGMDEDVGEHRLVERIFALLPADEARVIHAGTFPARHLLGLRLVIAFRTMGAVVSFLERVGWPGSVSEVDRISTAMEPHSSGWALGLDVGSDGLGSSLGVEWIPEKDRMDDALDWLVAESLCLPAKADGLKTFPGGKLFSNMHIFLNAEWRLSHVKITLRNAKWRAKAYLDLQAKAGAVD